jgi:CheY-like chemotaxis protein
MVPIPTQFSPRFGRLRILIVEDDEASLEMFRQMVEAFGAIPLLARTGEEALDRIRDRPDVILLDLMLPGMDGFEVADHLKATERSARIPIIAVTALNDQAVLERTWFIGFDAHLSKPITIDELGAALLGVLGDPSRR